MHSEQLKSGRRFNRVLIISLGLYCASLFLTAFTTGANKTTTGFEAVGMGALAILGGGLMEWIVWLANPLYFLSMAIRKKKRSRTLAICAAVTAATFLLWDNMLASESGGTTAITYKGPGYFLWLLSLLVWAIGNRPATIISAR